MTRRLAPGAFASVFLITAALAASPVLAAPVAAPGAASRAALDAEIPKLLAETKVESVSMARIVDRKVVLAAAWGTQRAGVKATAGSLYNIASLTKPITAEVVVRLASQGRLGIDEPMAPAWTDPDIAGDARRMLLTPRLALTHRTGFPNWRDRKTGLAFQAEPGGVIGYSGEGFNYVARFAEKKTGEPFEALAEAEVFGPLGMTRTAFTGRPWFEGRIAVPHDDAGKALEPTVAKAFNAADLVYTTAGDYAAFMVGVLEDRGLSPAVAAERGRIQADQMAEMCRGAKAATCPKAAGFGFSWQVLEFEGETIWMHTGKDDGLFTFAYLNRTTGDGAVILTNSEHGYRMILPVLERMETSGAFVRFLKGQMAG